MDRQSRFSQRAYRLLATIALLVFSPLPLLGEDKDEKPKEWLAVEKETDRLDPRWRLADIEADRAKIPDKENSAFHIIAVAKSAPNVDVTDVVNYEAIFAKLPAMAQLNAQQIQLIRGGLVSIKKPLAEARKLKDMPRGRFPLKIADDYISTLIPDHQKGRTVADWLRHDAYLLAHDKKHDEAVDSCHAILNAGRAYSDDPIIISHLIRCAAHQIVVVTLERVLAQGEPSHGVLRNLQASMEFEIEESTILFGVRGERAGAHQMCDNIRTGKVKAGILRPILPNAKGEPEPTEEMLRTSFMLSYPEFLRHSNRVVEMTKLPLHQRIAKMTELEKARNLSKNPLIQMLSPALVKVQQADCRGQATLRSAVVAIACERYRLKHKEWPKSLAALVDEKLLDAVPLDPFDGQPLRYRRTKDGIVLYSVGPDLTDNQGAIDRKRPQAPGTDIGFRVWNVEARRQPPLPPVSEKEEDR